MHLALAGAGRSSSIAMGGWCKEKRTSFLKKRSKKLLSIAPRPGPKQGAMVLPETNKSFLVLFFKKEHS
jgi:hypothetical protein